MQYQNMLEWNISLCIGSPCFMLLVLGQPPPPPTTSSPKGSSRASPRPLPGTTRTAPSAASRRPRGPRQPWPARAHTPRTDRGFTKWEGIHLFALLHQPFDPLISHTTRARILSRWSIDSTVCSYILLIESPPPPCQTLGTSNGDIFRTRYISTQSHLNHGSRPRKHAGVVTALSSHGRLLAPSRDCILKLPDGGCRLECLVID